MTFRPDADLTIWAALIFAFAGGLILNLMPCVLPVLFIKALGFAQAGAGRAGARCASRGCCSSPACWRPSWCWPASSSDLARSAPRVGWGYPAAVAAGRDRAGGGDDADRPQPARRLRDRHLRAGRRPGTRARRRAGPALSCTGALAVVVATPCTAPFMGAAMGYAVTQPPARCALPSSWRSRSASRCPWWRLSFAPGWLRLLPKPGRWMLVLKQAFAFPMFATAIWLVWVVSVQAGADGVLAALVARCSPRASSSGCCGNNARRRDGGPSHRRRRRVARGFAAARTRHSACRAGAAAEPRAAPTARPGRRSASQHCRRRAPGLRQFHRSVVHHLSCERTRRAVAAGCEGRTFAALDVVYLKADWTNRDADDRAEAGRTWPRRRAALSVLSGGEGRAGRGAAAIADADRP